MTRYEPTTAGLVIVLATVLVLAPAVIMDMGQAFNEDARDGEDLTWNIVWLASGFIGSFVVITIVEPRFDTNGFLVGFLLALLYLSEVIGI